MRKRIENGIALAGACYAVAALIRLYLEVF